MTSRALRRERWMDGRWTETTSYRQNRRKLVLNTDEDRPKEPKNS
jgi:hypothetical protein